MHLRTLGALIAFLGTAPAAAAQGSEHLTPVAGGGGGSAFQHECRTGEVLAGIWGGAGAVVDRLGAICVSIDSLGRWTGSVRRTAAAGGSGGTAYERLCPRDHAVSGIQGRAGMVIDRFQLNCRRLGARGATAGSHVALAAVGGTGGAAFGPWRCAGDLPGTAFLGNAGMLLDRVRLKCAEPLPPPPSIIRIQRPIVVKTEYCFGAIGMQCGDGQSGLPVSALCANGRCSINAGSWEHDQCCWANPNGMACRAGPLDYLRTDHGGRCVAEWNKAIQRLAENFVWQRNVDFNEPNRTGVVVHSQYCASAGTVVHSADVQYCCSRTSRPVTLPMDAVRIASIAPAVVANARVCQ